MIARVYTLFLLRRFCQSWRQTALTVLGLALGVSVFVSIHLTVGASIQSFRRTVQAVSGKAEWQLLAEGRELDERLFSRVKTHPTVAAAAPVIECTTELKNPPGRAGLGFGLDYFSERELDRFSGGLFRLKEEDLLSLLLTPRAVALSRAFAQELGKKKGDLLEVLVNGRLEALKIVVLLDGEEPSRAFGGQVGLMDIAQAQEVFGKTGRLDRIDLILRDQGRNGDATAPLKNILPPGVRMIEAGGKEQGTERMIRAYQLNLTALSFIAVLVGMYLIYNTSSLSVARRRKDLGVLRALGMLPGQVKVLILLEAAGYGLLGGLLGIAGGRVLAALLLKNVTRTITDLYTVVGVKEISLTFPVFAGLLAFSIFVSLLSAYIPARQAAALEPRQVIQKRAGLVETKAGRKDRLWILGLGLILSALPLTRLPAWGHWPMGGFASTASLTSGFSLLVPAVIRRGIRGFFPSPFRGRGPRLPIWLGGNYVHRYAGRMAVSMAALMIAVTMLISIGLMIRSFRQGVEDWIGRSISGDLFVGPVFPSNQGFSQFMDPKAVEEIRSLPELRHVYAYRGLTTTWKGYTLRIWAGDLEVIQRYGGLLFTEGESDRIFRQVLTQESVLVSEVLANQWNLRAGDRLELPTAEGLRVFSVAGVFYDYRTEGGAVWMDRRLFLKYWKDDRVNGLRLYLKDPTRSQELKQKIQERFTERGTLVIISNRELRERILNIFDQTFQVTYLLEAIAVIMAFLGIIHSSAISVLFRERELGILKAVGAEDRQIRRMILTETTLMGTGSLVLGAAAGTILSLILIFVVNKQSFGWTIPFHWSGAIYLKTTGIILLGSALAGWIPSRMALQKSAQEMLREE
jgi:putative ABC transport system permease protein